MSHQTGIKASESLTNVLKQAKSGMYRAIKITIENEKLEISDKSEPTSSFEQDYANCINKFIKDFSSCYILIKCNERSSNGEFKWIMILYTPDKAPVKDKMLYAATKASLKTFFGDDLIGDEIHGTDVSDIDYNGYKKHVAAQKAPPPLTDAEKLKAEIKKNEEHLSVTAKAETLRGICFPLDGKAADALSKLASGSINYVELIVDSKEEKILLGSSKHCTIKELASFECKDPRYHILKYEYNHQGCSKSAFVFVYTMPGYSCAIKDRMMYSSCKGPLIEMFESKYSKFERKLEEENLSGITEKYLYDELHPPMAAERAAFARPKRPGRI